MKKYFLKATTRDLVGRKVKKLRQQGLLPATVYGKSTKSVSITVKHDEFENIYKDAGETGLVELIVEGEKTTGLPAGRQVLVHSVQVHPISRTPLHVEFHQVDLKEKVHANVPVVLVGEAKAVADKIGVLLTLLDEVEVEALPTDLPEKIEVDISALAEVNQEFKVSDLNIPTGVTLLSDPAVVVVKIGALVTKEAEAEVKAEEAAEAAAAAEAAPVEGEVSTPAQVATEQKEKTQAAPEKTPEA